MSRLTCLIALVLLNANAPSATKPHVATFGKWTTVKWFNGHDEIQPLDLKIRPLHTKQSKTDRFFTI